jgi:hypothetical protein
LLLPAKITSSISAARIDLCDVSPIGRLNERFEADQPQPREFHSSSNPNLQPKALGGPHHRRENESAARRQQHGLLLYPRLYRKKGGKNL